MTKKSEDLAKRSRISTLKMVHSAKASHVGSSLSLIDILAVIYSEVADDSDAVLVSKGHAAAGTYAVMANVGKFPLEKLETYGMDGSTLGGHVNHTGNEGVWLSTGSLGHGLPYGIGLAIAQKRRSLGEKTFVIISDGECDEGTTWESALFAQQFNLNNLVLIIDRNRIQSLAGTEETLRLEPLLDKWKAFNWDACVVDGHNHLELEKSMQASYSPKVVIANTVKGKGVSFMEDSVAWHYKSPSDEELTEALNEIKGSKE